MIARGLAEELSGVAGRYWEWGGQRARGGLASLEIQGRIRYTGVDRPVRPAVSSKRRRVARGAARRTRAVRVRAPGAHRLHAKLEAEGFQSTLLDGDELVVEGAPSARVGEIAYQAGVPLHELVSESSSLEDVFLELTKGVSS